MLKTTTMQQAPFLGRELFGDYLTELGLRKPAVEVGTHRGDFACELLQHWAGVLNCVDPWVSGYDPQDPASNGDRQADYEACLELLSRFGNRVRIHRMVSESAVEYFADNSLSFVYIDGNHQPEYVRNDLNLWWDKVQPGGLLAGHDFICPGEKQHNWGRYVQPVVLEFADRHQVDPWLVVEPTACPWSYYFVKPRS